ncbi:hypothetical protein [Rubrivivax gelatinosus]|uniref:Uncharacterized protein n=1 Tax=Rubrivivax gelatinosus (strain NBRC 100245 / IL144) TaxID=983917 RepID=I0HRH1_RUBGI|nr:hypothetical protein [Rubrivivax gelatinosus]MBG6082140.1 hypothetical protein [Rubrivivax gelatinosus]BAL95608.1 hypothetical protein RGE_22670 [Rubrivivax gelatinosus IL144]
MTTTISLAPRSVVRDTLTDGLLAAGLSTVALVWRGREESTPSAPLNAISHWIWPRRALRQDEPSLRHTATGTAIHIASSMLWAGVYDLIRARRRRPTPLNAMADAAAVTAVAALVDLQLVPRRLTPGFEHRLSRPSLSLVYGSFAVGLALGGLVALRR